MDLFTTGVTSSLLSLPELQTNKGDFNGIRTAKDGCGGRR
jgi:hypothetical protein